MRKVHTTSLSTNGERDHACMHECCDMRGSAPALGESHRLVAVTLYRPLVSVDMDALRGPARHAIHERVPIMGLHRQI